ncbi:MAG: oxygen-dependent coproporphyrinogen oxidase [Deltaproteobacteria bacterium]|nr:oxygen-dependent coproporphyrinogen oxidase [Deltaproteobacteria bacterium]MDQ3295786.1 oxygen-dependent coproporphyrinogen oxidase [Myxococcota bacterium]
MSDLFDRAAKFFSELQGELCRSLAETDGSAEFTTDAWQRPGGGGGVARVLEGGALFEKAGVNWSNVEGELPAEIADHMPGQGRTFRASGISLVLHPRSPMVPTTHANFRCLMKGDALWFGGGADLTPYYFFREDAEHFHRTLAEACDRHRPIGDYDRFKAWCDEYFFLPHRNETRGIGGVFFDYLGAKDEHPAEAVFDFVRDLGRAFASAYIPIAGRRQPIPYGDTERAWQLRRRGRYVEFNLIYDRGTLFGLKTNGRIESILMSLPPLVRWDYDVMAQPGSPEAELLTVLRPNDWLDRAPTSSS